MSTSPDPQVSTWCKSTRSGSNGCVEVLLDPRAIGVRDSKLQQSPEFYVDAPAWRAFIAHLTTDSFTR